MEAGAKSPLRKKAAAPVSKSPLKSKFKTGGINPDKIVGNSATKHNFAVKKPENDAQPGEKLKIKKPDWRQKRENF